MNGFTTNVVDLGATKPLEVTRTIDVGFPKAGTITSRCQIRKCFTVKMFDNGGDIEFQLNDGVEKISIPYHEVDQTTYATPLEYYNHLVTLIVCP